MATAANLTYTGNKIAEDFHNTIYDISPEDTPFLSMAKRFSATNTLHQWTTDALESPATNARLEGDDHQNTARAQPTTYGNYCQIVAKYASVSGTFNAVKKYGRRNEMAYQIARAAKAAKRDLEYALVRNQASTAGAAASARTMGSLESWISPNYVRANGTTGGTSSGYVGGIVTAPTDSASSSAFTEADLQSAIGLAWADGGDPRILMMSYANKKIFSTFTGIATRFNDVRGATQAKVIGGADVYVSDVGTHTAVINRWMRDTAVLCIDPEYVGVAYLRPWQTIDVARTGDSEKKMVLCEATLVVQNKDAHSKIINCA